MRALASVHRRRGDTDEASRILSHALELQPDNQRLRLDRLQLLMETGDRDAAYQEMRDLLRSESGRRAEFSCRECGYRTEEYLWRCPACHRWETFRE
jgi:lipopolysaccharide biosynthesis regulator YciM